MKSGFVVLVGMPNAGKSSLLNALSGSPWAGVTPRAQTTRKSLSAVVTDEDSQMVIMDTPGQVGGEDPLSAMMREAIQRCVDRADVVCWVLDATACPEASDPNTQDMASRLGRSRKAGIAVFTKCDKVSPPRIQSLLDEWRDKLGWEGESVSALRGTGMAGFRMALLQRLGEGPALYPEEELSDRPQRFFVEEALRQASLEILREEVPHATAILVEEFKEREAGKTYVKAVLYVEKEGQKRIWIGKDGYTIKNVGRRARQHLEGLFGNEFYLDLWVKVAKNWRKDRAWLSRLGFGEAP